MADILGKIGEAFVLLRADGSQLSEDMKKERAKIEKELSSWGGRFKNVGSAMTLGITTPLLAIGAAAVKAGFVIDDALDNIRLKTGATGDTLDDLTLSFKNVFKDVPDDAMAVSDAISEVNRQTGLTGSALDKLAKQQLDLARITKTELNANVQDSAKMFNAWNIATEKQSESLDFVFKTSQKTGVGIGELMQKVTQFGPILREFGFSWEESIVLLGQWQKAGLSAEQILGSMRIAAKHFAESGVPMREGLEKTLQVIKDLGPGTASTNLAIQVFGKSGIVMADAIHKGALSVDDLLNQLKKSPETIDKAVRETEGFAEGLSRLKNEATLALEPLGTRMIAVGEKLLPMFLRLGEIAIKVAEWFAALPEPAQEFALALGGILAAAGPTIYILGQLLTNASTIATTFAKVGPVVINSLGTMTSAATLTSGAMYLIGAAIAAWSLYKIGQAISLINDLHNQSVAAAKDMENANVQGQRNIQLAYQKTGIVVKDAMDAQRLLTAYATGLRGEQIKGVASTSLQYQAWQKGAEEAKKKGTAVKNLTGDTKAQSQSEGGLKIATDATADAQAKALMAQLGLNKGKKEGKSAADEYAESLKKLNQQLSGEDVTKNAKMYLDLLGSTNRVAGLTKSELEGAAQALLDFITKMERAGTTTTQQFKDAKIAYADVMAELRKTDIDERIKKISESFSGDELKRNAEAYIGYLQQIGTTTGLTGEETKEITDALEAYMSRMQQLGQTTSEEFAKVQAARDKLLLPTKAPSIDLSKMTPGMPVPDRAAEIQRQMEQLSILGKTGSREFEKLQQEWDVLMHHMLETGKTTGTGLFESIKGAITGGLGANDFGKQIGDTILGALKGGGDVGKSVGGLIGNNIGSSVGKKLSDSLGKHVGSKMGGMFGKTVGGVLGSVIPGLGTMLGSMLGDFIGKGLGKIMGKIGGFFKDLFGGPSKKELEGRSLAGEARDVFVGSLNEEQKKELAIQTGITGAWRGNEKGAATVIAIRDALVSVGHAGEEATMWADRIFQAEKQGPDAVRKVITELKNIIGDKIPGLAVGGVVSSPTLATIGERGPEAIMPIENLEQLMLNRDVKVLATFGGFLRREREMSRPMPVMTAPEPTPMATPTVPVPELEPINFNVLISSIGGLIKVLQRPRESQNITVAPNEPTTIIPPKISVPKIEPVINPNVFTSSMGGLIKILQRQQNREMPQPVTIVPNEAAPVLTPNVAPLLPERDEMIPKLTLFNSSIDAFVDTLRRQQTPTVDVGLGAQEVLARTRAEPPMGSMTPADLSSNTELDMKLKSMIQMLGKRQINFSPEFHGVLGPDMKTYLRTTMWPAFLEVLREDGALRAETSVVING